MTLASAFLELEHAASRLEERFAHLDWAVASAKVEDPPAVVLGWQDLATDFRDLAREIAAASRAGRVAVNGRAGMQGAHGALALCQERYGALWLAFCTDALSPGRRRELDRLSRRRGALADWTHGVTDACERCLTPLYEVGVALGRTWQELVERAWLGLLVQSPPASPPAAHQQDENSPLAPGDQDGAEMVGEPEGAGA